MQQLRTALAALPMHVRNHRKTTIIAGISLVAALVGIPYVQAMNQNNQTNTSSGQQSKNIPATQLQESGEDAMPQTTPADNSTSTNSSRSSVTVNGQTVEVPENSDYHKVTEDADSRTEIKVESRQSGNGDGSSNSSSSSVNISVDSQSHSSTADPD